MVNDFANIIPHENKARLEKKLSDFEKQTTIEIAVVTVPSLDGDTIENFTTRLFKEWGIGKKDKNNGIMFLVAPKERKMRIEVGYGLEEYITDATSKKILSKEVRPYMQKNDFQGGIEAGVDAIIKRLKNVMPSQFPEGKESLPQKKSSSFSWFWVITLSIATLLTGLLIIFRLIKKSDRKSLPYLKQEFVKLKQKIPEAEKDMALLMKYPDKAEWKDIQKKFSEAPDIVNRLEDQFNSSKEKPDDKYLGLIDSGLLLLNQSVYAPGDKLSEINTAKEKIEDIKGEVFNIKEKVSKISNLPAWASKLLKEAEDKEKEAGSLPVSHVLAGSALLLAAFEIYKRILAPISSDYRSDHNNNLIIMPGGESSSHGSYNSSGGSDSPDFGGGDSGGGGSSDDF